MMTSLCRRVLPLVKSKVCPFQPSGSFCLIPTSCATPAAVPPSMLPYPMSPMPPPPPAGFFPPPPSSSFIPLPPPGFPSIPLLPPGLTVPQYPTPGLPPLPPGFPTPPAPYNNVPIPMPPPPPGFFPRKWGQDTLSRMPTLQGHPLLPPKPGSVEAEVVSASATISAEPELRDLRKESTGFMPTSVKRKKAAATPKVNAAPFVGTTDGAEPVVPQPDLPSALQGQFGPAPPEPFYG